MHRRLALPNLIFQGKCIYPETRDVSLKHELLHAVHVLHVLIKLYTCYVPKNILQGQKA